MSKTDSSFEDFKNQVAVKNGYQDWKEWKRYCEGETEMEEMMTEATTLFVDSERKRIWDKACQAQKAATRLSFGGCNYEGEGEWFIQFNEAKYDPNN